jgi:hypothetical membrane protein
LKQIKKFSQFIMFYSVVLLFLAMFILPYFSVDSYAIAKNTTSHLGAQKAPNAWIMNLCFLVTGLSCVIEAWLHLKNWVFQKYVLSIFGVSFFLTGFFRHAPIVEGISYNLLQEQLHSVFAWINGFSFTLLVVSVIFIEKKRFSQLVDSVVALFLTLLSLLMVYLSDYSGIWQRIIFIISFVWLLFFLKRMKKQVLTIRI